LTLPTSTGYWYGLEARTMRFPIILLLKSHFYKGLYTPYLTAMPHLPADFIAGVRIIARI